MLVKAVENILTQVGLWDKAKMKAETLSGGEQQRVAVARALVANPPLILADEPTGNLDPANAREVMRLLVKAHLQGSTVLVATHDPTLLKIIKGARVIHLEKGRLRKGSAP